MASPSNAAIDAFLNLTEDRQRKALSSMSMETKQSLLSAIRSRKSLSPEQIHQNELDADLFRDAPPAQTNEDKSPGYFKTVVSRLSDMASGLWNTAKQGDIKALTGVSALESQYGLDQRGQGAWDKVWDPNTKTYVYREPNLGDRLVSSIPFFGPSITEAEKLGREGKHAEALGVLTSDVLIPVVGPKALGETMSKVGQLRRKVATGTMKKAAGFVTRTGAEEVTRPAVNKQLAKIENAEAKQAIQDAAIEQENKAIAKAAAEENARRHGVNQIKAAEQEKNYQNKVQEQGRQYEGSVQETAAANEAIAEKEARKQTLQTEMKNTSRQVGERIKEAERELRLEANEKYAPVHQAVTQDPGISSATLIDAVNHAENNILKGSSENIKQFREILSMQSEAENVMGIDLASPEGRGIAQFLEQQGVSAENPNISFKDLQGYSSEIGGKLAKGYQPGQGDVYRALKYVKDQIDLAKMEIADRNNVLPQLQEADAFYSAHQDTFWNPKSAVAQVRKSVGVLDPEYYSDPLVTGKAAQTGLGKLRSIPSRHSASLNQIADLAESIKRSKEELSGLPSKTAEVKPMPVEPEPIKPPSGVTLKQPVSPKFKTSPEVARPRELTAERIIAEKEERVRAKASELGGARRFDFMKILSHPISGTVEVFAEKIAAAGFRRPEVIDYLTRFTPEDLVYVDKLPEPNKTTLRKNIQAIMDSEVKSGKPPIQPSTSLQKFLSGAGMVGPKPVSNRSEAKERLKSVSQSQ